MKRVSIMFLWHTIQIALPFRSKFVGLLFRKQTCSESFFSSKSFLIEQIESERPFGKEHFGESTFFAKSTLRRALLERRALWGEHYLSEEHFGESTSWAESTLGRALFERRALWGEHIFLIDEQNILEGRALDATVGGGGLVWTVRYIKKTSGLPPYPHPD